MSSEQAMSRDQLAAAEESHQRWVNSKGWLKQMPVTADEVVAVTTDTAAEPLAPLTRGAFDVPVSASTRVRDYGAGIGIDFSMDGDYPPKPERASNWIR